MLLTLSRFETKHPVCGQVCTSIGDLREKFIPVSIINGQLTVFFGMCCFFIDRSCSDETWLFKADLVWWVAWKAKPSREISKSPALWIAMSLIHNSLGMLKKHCTTFGLFSCQTEILPKMERKTVKNNNSCKFECVLLLIYSMHVCHKSLRPLGFSKSPFFDHFQYMHFNCWKWKKYFYAYFDILIELSIEIFDFLTKV